MVEEFTNWNSFAHVEIRPSRNHVLEFLCYGQDCITEAIEVNVT